MSSNEKSEEKSVSKRYRAPALQKGLEILELLVMQTKPITLSKMSQLLGRSKNEIFRMVQELETKGYISRNLETDGYAITTKLFSLGLEHPPNKTLMEVAQPLMREFSELSGQSCHLAVAVDDKIIVICRVQSPGPVSFSVRVGHQQSLLDSTSGMVFFTWQSDGFREGWLDKFEDEGKIVREDYIKMVDDCRKKGIVKKRSRFIQGVTDLAAPILRDGLAVASLTAPCIRRIDSPESDHLPVDLLKDIAERITIGLEG